MPTLLPMLKPLEASYNGSTPLPPRIERIARLVAAQQLTEVAIARVGRTSRASVQRLKLQPLVRLRVAHLRERAITLAMSEEPLADQRRRILLAAEVARTLHAQLVAEEYRTAVGVTKGGEEIIGFDRGRVAELRAMLQLIDDMLTPKQKRTEETTTLAVQLTTDQAVTRVQALLSRTTAGVYKEGDAALLTSRAEDSVAPAPPVAPIDGGGGG